MNELGDVAHHLGPIVVGGQHCVGLVDAKMSHEATTMSFLQEQIAKRRCGYTKLVLFEKKPFVQVKIIKTFVNRTLGKNISKECVG